MAAYILPLLLLLSFALCSSSSPLGFTRNLTFFGSAHFKNDVIILTEAAPFCRYLPNVGKIFNYNPIVMVDYASSADIFFSAQFAATLVASSPPCLAGDGIAFFLTSNPRFYPTFEGYLGLPDSHLQNPFFAVELDTKFNPILGDINDNHVGIDLNSIFSVASMDPGIDLKGGLTIFTWLEYVHSQKTITVWVGDTNQRPMESILRVHLDLSPILGRPMWVGLSASNSGGGSSTQEVGSFLFHTVRLEAANNTNCFVCFTTTPLVKEPPRTKDRGVIMLVSLLIVFASCLAIVTVAVVMRYSLMSETSKESCVERGKYQRFHPSQRKTTIAKKIRLAEILSATNGFHDRQIIGKGATAVVYKAHLPSFTNAVAVKRFNEGDATGSFRDQFATEFATTVGCLRHTNLVQLQGWCCEGKEVMLVYDYMENGSLDNILHDHTHQKSPLTFENRHQILLGVSAALRYLHEECDRQIIHRDIKTANIMLDAQLNAKLGDFGFAEVYEHGSTRRDVTLPVGTMGYLAPDYLCSGIPTVKSDVYSFGVVVLEVASGKRPLNEGGIALTDWVWDLWEANNLTEAADPRLLGRFQKIEMERMLMVGLTCVHPNYEKRPTMNEAAQMLSGGCLPDLPAQKPRVTMAQAMPRWSRETTGRPGGEEAAKTQWATAQTRL